jgi:hypothetical protein
LIGKTGQNFAMQDRKGHMKSIEVQLNEALENIKTLTKENTELKEAVTTHRKATAKAERESQLKESKLPEPCVKRIHEAFGNSTDNAGLKEAINVEAEYLKSLRTIPKHNGADDNAGTLQESDAKVDDLKREQYLNCLASNMSEAEARGFSGYTGKA